MTTQTLIKRERKIRNRKLMKVVLGLTICACRGLLLGTAIYQYIQLGYSKELTQLIGTILLLVFFYSFTIKDFVEDMKL